MNSENILEIRDLRTYFHTIDGVVRAVDGVDLEIRSGETLGLVGESGSGKSVTAHSIMRLLPKRVSRIHSGEVSFRRRNGSTIDMATLDPEGDLIREIRGDEIAMIFQEPMTSLSPLHTIGDQITEAIELHQNVNKQEAIERAIEMLTAVRIGNAKELIRSYPHQFSGGMRQRAMIAMALSCNPSLLIADEPTTALDVTIQAQILDLMRQLQAQFGSAILMITHNLGVINEVADRVAVMYMGKVVEVADRRTLFKRPAHPYTIGLLKSVPRLGETREQQKLVPIKGLPPDLIDMPPTCAFLPRCDRPLEVCRQEPWPALRHIAGEHYAACYHVTPESA